MTTLSLPKGWRQSRLCQRFCAMMQGRIYIAKAQQHQKKNYDCHLAVPMFKRGNLVLRKNMANTHRMGEKLDAKWLGPYEVQKITEKGLYQLKCTKSGKVLKQVFTSLQLKGYSICPIPKVMKYFYCTIRWRYNIPQTFWNCCLHAGRIHWQRTSYYRWKEIGFVDFYHWT